MDIGREKARRCDGLDMGTTQFLQLFQEVLLIGMEMGTEQVLQVLPVQIRMAFYCNWMVRWVTGFFLYSWIIGCLLDTLNGVSYVQKILESH